MREHALRWMVVGLIVGSAACATTNSTGSKRGEGEGEERRVPPEVTDHTVDERSESERSQRPRVDVELDRNDMAGVTGSGYEATVRRGAQQCYSQSTQGEGESAEGSVVYEVIVTRNGYVAATDLMSTNLRDDSVQRCVEGVISRLRFEVPVRTQPVFRLFFRLDFYLETLVPTEPPV